MDREITLRDYGRVIWSGRWLILGAAVAAAVIGLLVTFITSTTYSATALVSLGQATTVSGSPIQTPLTNPVSAASVLRGDAVVGAVAQEVGVSDSRVRDSVRITLPRLAGQAAGNQSALATITVTDSDEGLVRRVIDAYTQRAFGLANTAYQGGIDIYENRVQFANGELTRVNRDIERYSDQLEGATSEFQVLALSQLLSATQSQSLQIRADLNAALFALNKAKNIERPEVIDAADSISSSTSGPRRLRSVLLAAILGLIIGIVVTFVWKGSPAGRAGRQ